MNEFIWQDIELTSEFKTAYTKYLNKNGYDIEFLGATAVITSPSTKYIYVPNQWFVIASYAVEVYEELQRYKKYFKKVADQLGERIDIYAKRLRDSATKSDRSTFIDCARNLFSEFSGSEELVEESSSRLWRFVNDYAWWSGQKTIDRHDFYVSVILNMLNLVNVSQGYVADIVNAYATDPDLRDLVRSIDRFTVNMDIVTSQDGFNYAVLEENDNISMSINEDTSGYETIPKPQRVKIKIKDHNKLKEFKYKG